MYRPPLANGRVKLCLVSTGTLHPDSQILGSSLYTRGDCSYRSRYLYSSSLPPFSPFLSLLLDLFPIVFISPSSVLPTDDHARWIDLAPPRDSIESFSNPRDFIAMKQRDVVGARRRCVERDNYFLGVIAEYKRETTPGNERCFGWNNIITERCNKLSNSCLAFRLVPGHVETAL